MPKCQSCGQFYDNPNDMELVRNKENRWVSVCRSCLNKNVDIDKIDSVRVAVEETALEQAAKPNIDVSLVAGDPIANAEKLLASLRTLRHTGEKTGRVRKDERRTVDLVVNFTLARDDASHEGFVKDISQGGMLIKTAKQLAKGQIIQFDWKTPMPPVMASFMQGNAEVRRSTRNEDGTYSVGLRFVKRQAAKGANRRRFRRYRCDMIAYYQRDGSSIMSRGSVRDISQGGCQLMADEELLDHEQFYVRLVGGGGGRGDLVGTVAVRRVIAKEIEYEIGCSFQKMKIERNEDMALYNPNGAAPAG